MIRATRDRYSRRLPHASAAASLSALLVSVLAACLFVSAPHRAEARELSNITVSPTAPSVNPGAILQFTGTGFFDDLTSNNLRPATLALGDDHSCVMTAVGKVLCWGQNSSSQLGNTQSTGIAAIPEEVTGITTAAALAAGSLHTCAVLASGEVRCWGDNSYGQLGNGTTNPTTIPVTVTGISTARAVATGTGHSCALLANATVKCWGHNTSGQLGNGTTNPSTTPVTVSGITTATDVVAGAFHTCARLTGGFMQCWGSNGFGQLGDGGTMNRSVPISVEGLFQQVTMMGAGNDHTCALLASGMVKCWGFNMFGNLGNGTLVNSVTPVIVTEAGSQMGPARALSSGPHNNCARMTDDTLRCWGANFNGALGNGGNADSASALPVSGVATAVAVENGYSHTCAILANGSMRCWGNNAAGQLGNNSTNPSLTAIPVWGVSQASSIIAGSLHSCALLGGLVHCWGYNGFGQLGNGSFFPNSPLVPVRVVGITNATALGAGEAHTCARLADSTLKCWGGGGNGQLGNGGTATTATPVTVTGITTATAVSGGSNHTCALLSTGGVRCWGLNGFGQLGTGNNNNSLVPVAVTGITTATAIATGSNHSCARLADSTLRCWGANFAGGLGNATFNDSNTPVTVSGISTALGITAGGDTSCAVLSSGALRCWGDNSYGQLGTNTGVGSSASPLPVIGVSTATAVTTGLTQSCARLSNGRLQCWGANSDGQLGNGGTTPSPVPVDVTQTTLANAVWAGGSHVCALRADNATLCWGSNSSSQLGSVTPAPAAVLNWTSGNPAVATIVASGVAQVLTTGVTTIAASYGGRSIGELLTSTAPDRDGDGVPNVSDNCTVLANPSQCDSDNDGFGNRCDGDFNQTSTTNAADTTLFRAELGKPSVGPTYNEADINCNGFVNSQDTTLFRGLLGSAPGPAGSGP